MIPDEPSQATRILLVEDEAIIALDLRHRLESLGYVVTGIAVNGADALSLAHEALPTLVLMDINIQGPIDGIETAKRLTAVMDVPIVFLTAYADAATTGRAKQVRPYGYLLKPFDERELATTIEMAVYRHKSEAQARLLEQALTSANTGILVADARKPGMPISLCNPAFERMTGYEASDVMGRSPWFLEGPQTDARASTEIREALNEQRDCQTTLLVHRRDGTPFWDDLSLSVVRNPVGEVTHFLIFHSDASARKNAEAAWFQAQKVEAIGHLAGGVAHDFNNILAVITGYCEMAQRQVDAQHAVRPRLDQILKAANRAAALTRQLLAFSRRQVLQPRPLDLNLIIADTQKMLGRLIGENVSVVIKPGPALGTISADPGQIEQIILNLAVNGRDAMPMGGALTIETRNVDLEADHAATRPPAPAGRYVLLTVSDTGTGMTPEVQARVFEPFFTTKPEGQGTGLGLATVYGIVKQSEGYVSLESAAGLGSTFRIYLPRVDRPTEEAQPEPGSSELPRGDETVLLAEDTESLREVIQETLEGCGYRVLPARDGTEALALARTFEGTIHLLLTDVVMPKLGGAELALALSELRPSVRVVFMSGYTDGALSRHGVLAEGVMLIEKPFTSSRLTKAVREALDRPSPPLVPRKA
jgi:PAS domain S-box-containing protein